MLPWWVYSIIMYNLSCGGSAHWYKPNKVLVSWRLVYSVSVFQSNNPFLWMAPFPKGMVNPHKPWNNLNECLIKLPFLLPWGISFKRMAIKVQTPLDHLSKWSFGVYFITLSCPCFFPWLIHPSKTTEPKVKVRCWTTRGDFVRLFFCWGKRSPKKTSMLCHEKSAYVLNENSTHPLFLLGEGFGKVTQTDQRKPTKSPAPNRSLNITTALWDPSFQCAFHKLYNCSRPESKTIWMTTPNMFGGPGWKFVLLVIMAIPPKTVAKYKCTARIYIYTYVKINIHQCYRPRKSLPFCEVCANQRTNTDTNNESWFVKEIGY